MVLIDTDKTRLTHHTVLVTVNAVALRALQPAPFFLLVMATRSRYHFARMSSTTAPHVRGPSVLNSRLSWLSRPKTAPTAISSSHNQLTSIPTKPTAYLGRKGGRGGVRVRERPERSESSSTLVNCHNLGPRLTHLTTLPGSIELDVP